MRPSQPISALRTPGWSVIGWDSGENMNLLVQTAKPRRCFLQVPVTLPKSFPWLQELARHVPGVNRMDG